MKKETLDLKDTHRETLNVRIRFIQFLERTSESTFNRYDILTSLLHESNPQCAVGSGYCSIQIIQLITGLKKSMYL